jgi:hypothetical protein
MRPGAITFAWCSYFCQDSSAGANEQSNCFRESAAMSTNTTGEYSDLTVRALVELFLVFVYIQYVYDMLSVGNKP